MELKPEKMNRKNSDIYNDMITFANIKIFIFNILCVGKRHLSKTGKAGKTEWKKSHYIIVYMVVKTVIIYNAITIMNIVL